MDISLLYFDGCPNWRTTEGLIRQVMAELALPPAALALRRVVTSEEAEELSFHGSPTVLVNGEDPFAQPDAAVGLACRVYPTVNGLAGSPSKAQLTDALRARV